MTCPSSRNSFCTSSTALWRMATASRTGSCTNPLSLTGGTCTATGRCTKSKSLSTRGFERKFPSSTGPRVLRI
ncbi:hypothetical protein ATCV1_z068R [Acanthocystis turfacea chlorella virus 1]|uniref:Uncharacterized protein z068R n=1 Tax=Chlorovirus heliozoae TaxID=322019 RepID=A7K828_9PHYC|nr:hypothetical protein ATCV1_z068R [Acanthocystis turfacea chlorella virus 1]ABT16202.1 hypothetical protein ATCV1_z068R [Acanthocystis turfacea chlorella virus 1]